MTKSTQNVKSRVTAFWISGLYALVASLWIYASDRLVHLIAKDVQQSMTLQSYKGHVFVAVTALLLYLLIKNALVAVSEQQVHPDNTLASYTHTSASVPPSPHSVRTPLLIFTLLVGAIGSAGYLGHLQQKEIVRQEQQDELASIATEKTEQIASWLAERRNDAQVFANDPLFVRQAGQWLTEGASDGNRADLLLNRLTILNEAYDFKTVALLDEQGRVRLSPSNYELDMDQQTRALRALNTNRTEISDLYQPHNTAAMPAAIDIIAPILSDNHMNGQPIGAMYLQIDPQRYLFPLIQSWPTPSASAEVLIVRREGNSILFLNELRHRKHTALTFSLPLEEAKLPAAMAARGQVGFVEGLDYRQIPVLAVVSPVPNSPWFLVAKVDVQEVYAPLNTIARLMALLVGVFITGAGVGLGFWWQQQRTRFLTEYYRNEFDRRVLVQQYDYLSKYGRDIVILMDKAGQLLDVNDSGVSAYGYPRQELLRLNIRDLRAPETLAVAKEQMQSVMDEGGLLFESVHRRKDGSQFPVEVNSRSLDIQGKCFLLSIIRNTTERKQAEFALRESEARYRILFEQAPDPILLIDQKTGMIVGFNEKACENLGYTPEEFAKLTIADIEYANTPDELAQRAKHLIETGSDNFETKHRAKEGKTRDMLISSRAIEISGKPLVQMLCRDITQRKRIEAQMRQQEMQLIQADKMASLGILVSGVAHEINNPNHMIKMNAQLLLEAWDNLARLTDDRADDSQTPWVGELSYEELRETFPVLLQDIADGAVRIQKIVTNLKDFARPEAKVLETAYNLNDVVKRALALLSHPIKKKTEQIQVDLDTDLPRLVGNPQQLEQVIVNLVLNALDALPDYTHTVRITTRFDKTVNCVKLQVEDNGIGIPSEHLKRIFDPFFTTKLDRGGTGLGLFIAYKLIKAHAGTLSFTSEPGKGTVAQIELPLAGQEIEIAEALMASP